MTEWDAILGLLAGIFIFGFAFYGLISVLWKFSARLDSDGTDDNAANGKDMSEKVERLKDQMMEIEIDMASGAGNAPRRGKPGRKPSPRTFQIHPKLLPEIGEAIVAEAEMLGITQGHLVEKMWHVYVASDAGRGE